MVLPKSNVPLVNLMTNSAIEAANKAIRATLLERPCVTETDGELVEKV